MQASDGLHVAVIGAGPGGLAALKSLREEGFHVTGFERRSEPGGVWSFTYDPSITSVTKYTSAQLSKFATPFSDFPHTDEYPCHARGTVLGEYYQQYARHFGLDRHIHFNTTVTSIVRHGDEKTGGKWIVSYYKDAVGSDEDDDKPVAEEKELAAGEEGRVLRQDVFDKVVHAVGSETMAKYPDIEGLEKFEGRFIHGQAFKRPEEFAGLNVIVVGQGNSGADCAVELSSYASTVHFSHRRSSIILPRVVDGQRFDKVITWKASRVGYWINEHLPLLSTWLTNSMFRSTMQRAWGTIEREYRLQPDLRYAGNPVTLLINDDLVPALRDGRVRSAHGIRRVVGAKRVEMEDGIVLEDIDAIVACTGYHTSFDLLGDAMTFTHTTATGRDALKVPPQPDLYQNVFSLSYPDSLACLNYIAIPENTAGCSELASMAIAQVWSGKTCLPPRAEMRREVSSHQSWFERRCLREPVTQLPGMVRGGPWLEFVHRAAGTGLYENLSCWTWTGLVFSLTRPWMYAAMAYGVNTPHMWRFFETGKRRAWEGAEEAILHANRMSKVDLEDKTGA